MKRKFKSVIFDLDQTLVDTTNLTKYVEAIKNNPSGTEGNMAAWREHDRHIKDCNLYEGMRQVFNFINANHIQTAIVSNSCKRRIKAISEAFDIPVSANLMIGRYGVIPRVSVLKPDIRIFQKAIEQLDTNPEDIISFGNEASDIKAAHNAGVEAVACFWGATEQEKAEMIQATPDHIIYNPVEIIPLISK